MTLNFTIDEDGNRIELNQFEQVALRMERRAFGIAGEQARIAKVKAFGTVPAICGPEIVSPAPARGLVAAFTDIQFKEQEGGEFKPVNAAYEGRQGMRIGDAFDVMTDQAKRAKAVCPFTNS